MNGRILKVSYDEKTVLVKYELEQPGGTDEYTCKSHDAPAVEFTQALDALREHVLQICELPKSWALGLGIRGVSFSYAGDENVMGATITALKTLAAANSPLVINTPHAPSEPYSEGVDETVCLSGECVAALRALQQRAWEYVRGIRAQRDLFAGEDVGPARATA